ncbi:hypothetical protein M0R45_031244 [Rubus argutus]|uniref:Uncharacterized protein n=1 Tax=Rubus argutus TaxID=59490 RepID=A0AAW1WE38_RUBAR
MATNFNFTVHLGLTKHRRFYSQHRRRRAQHPNSKSTRRSPDFLAAALHCPSRVATQIGPAASSPLPPPSLSLRRCKPASSSSPCAQAGIPKMASMFCLSPPP